MSHHRYTNHTTHFKLQSNYFLIVRNKTKAKHATRTKTTPPQNGKVTHHHDHVATSVIPSNFNATNKTPISPITTLPPDDPELSLILSSYVKLLTKIHAAPTITNAIHSRPMIKLSIFCIRFCIFFFNRIKNFGSIRNK